MVTIDEIQNDMMLEEFNECLEKCQECSAYITLKQATVSPKGEISYITISEMTIEVEALPQFYQGSIFLRLIAADDTELKKIYSLWETLLERSTAMARANRQNDYILSVDLIKLENEETIEATAYNMSYIMPNRVYPEYPEQRSLMLEFNSDKMRFEKANINMVEVNDELDYAEEVSKQDAIQESMKKPALGEKEQSENSEYIDNDDYLM